MPIALILDMPGTMQEQYEIAHNLLSKTGEPGAIVHIAGPTEKGWRVVEVWPSQDDADQFLNSTRVRMAFETAGIDLPQAISFPVHALYVSPRSA